MLVACVMVTAVFSVSLTTKRSGGKNDRSLIAAQAARQVSARLKNFVTGCDCNITTGICTAASCTLQGPTPVAGVASWYFNYPLGGIFDCFYGADPGAAYFAGCGAGTPTYALRVGVTGKGYHVISGLLPAAFEAAPFNARVVYSVTTPQLIGPRPVPQVTVDVRWTEP